MSIFFNYNGKLYKEEIAVIHPSSRGLKYGDGLFETMKMIDGKIILSNDHFERLFYGMKILEFQIPYNFSKNYFEDLIFELSKKNNHFKKARIRLNVFRGKGDITNFKNVPEFLIQTSEIPDKAEWNDNGLLIDIYSGAKKSCDLLANIKTNNFLPYAMAAIYAEKNNLNDCILLNSYERICDTTIANIFIIKNDIVYTPSLNEGCIAGIIRKWIIKNLKDFAVIQKEISVNELEEADEAFLTNSISYLHWVGQFRSKRYSNDKARHIYKILQTI